MICDFDNIFSLNTSPNLPIVAKAKKISIENLLKKKKLDNLSPRQIAALDARFNLLKADVNATRTPNRDLWKPLLDNYISISKVHQSEIIAEIKTANPNIDSEIENLYQEKIFILKLGAIEQYTLSNGKDLSQMISFCLNIDDWLTQSNIAANEVKSILAQIVVG